LILYELHFFTDNFVRGKIMVVKGKEDNCGTASIEGNTDGRARVEEQQSSGRQG